MIKNILKLVIGVMILISFSIKQSYALPAGESSFQVKAPRGPVTIYTYKPESFGPSSPVWVVMHGVGRTAGTYYDTWRTYAELYGAMLIVPNFSKNKWDKSWRYALGNVSTSKLVPLPRRDWAFTVVENAFNKIISEEGTGQKKFYLYGHSAGGQFTHRYVMYTGGRNIKLAISANAGWYILPDYKFYFPYGLKRNAISNHILKRALATPMVILLGEKDIDWSKGVRRNPQTNFQGPHRLARGEFFYQYSKRVAKNKQYKYRWLVETVPDAGHKNSQMAPAAAALFARAHGLKVLH